MISEDAYTTVANALQCDVPAIKAVTEVEAPQGGFLDTGEPRILFEAHIFYRLVKRHKGEQLATHYVNRYPSICQPTWTQGRKYYLGGKGEHKRLQLAANLDRGLALQSASWGKFQIMGFNWKSCGYESLQGFINAMYDSEESQLEAFAGFIRNNSKLLKALRTHDWATFARTYNGPGYAQNQYDVRLAEAYRKLC